MRTRNSLPSACHSCYANESSGKQSVLFNNLIISTVTFCPGKAQVLRKGMAKQVRDPGPCGGTSGLSFYPYSSRPQRWVITGTCSTHTSSSRCRAGRALLQVGMANTSHIPKTRVYTSDMGLAKNSPFCHWIEKWFFLGPGCGPGMY